MSIPSITTEAGSDCRTLYRIVARHFVAGIEIGHPRHRCAPIVHYMADWTPDAIVAYCRRKGWTITRHRRRRPDRSPGESVARYPSLDWRDDDTDDEIRYRGLVLATLCDMVLGEDAKDRSDDALIRGVRRLLNGQTQD